MLIAQLALKDGLVDVQAQRVRKLHGRDWFAFRFGKSGKRWGIADVATGVAMLTNMPRLADAWKLLEMRSQAEIDAGVVTAEKYIAEKGYTPRGKLTLAKEVAE
jgi:hypothetical protein